MRLIYKTMPERYSILVRLNKKYNYSNLCSKAILCNTNEIIYLPTNKSSLEYMAQSRLIYF